MFRIGGNVDNRVVYEIPLWVMLEPHVALTKFPDVGTSTYILTQGSGNGGSHRHIPGGVEANQLCYTFSF